MKYIENIIIWFLSKDEGRARRIIKKAHPKLHVAEKPRQKKKADKGTQDVSLL